MKSKPLKSAAKFANAEKAQQAKKEPQPSAAKAKMVKTNWQNTEGNNVYEDANGIRFVDNGGGFLVGESVGINMRKQSKILMTHQLALMNITVEEVEARQPKQPPKERLLIKIDDELDAALDDLANVFKEQGKH